MFQLICAIMSEESSYEKILQRYLSDELRVVNSHLPQHRKPLAELLSEEYPQVICKDGGSQSFKKKELEYIASLLDEEECQELLIPILIEVASNQGEAIVLSPEGIEEKIISAILGMSPAKVKGGLRIYRPQISALRNVLKTTTQYAFSQRIA